MSKPSQAPQKPAEGGNLKYVLIGLLFLGAAVVAWTTLGTPPPPPAPAAPPPPPPPEPPRQNPLATQDLVLEEEPEPTPEPEPEKAKPRRPGAPKPGDWECSGDLAGAVAVINENRAQIRSCYERRLKVNNVLQGDVRLRLKVGSTGKVVATATTGSLRDAEVLSCMRQLAQKWTFAVPTGGACAVVAVPFSFTPKP